MTEPLPYCEFLYYKAKYFGIDLSSSVNNPLRNNIENPQISVSPNPSSNTINISYSILKNQNIKISLIEPISGRTHKILYSGVQTEGGFNMPLDISNLSKGLYLIVIQTEDQYISKKFIKN